MSVDTIQACHNILVASNISLLDTGDGSRVQSRRCQDHPQMGGGYGCPSWLRGLKKSKCIVAAKKG